MFNNCFNSSEKKLNPWPADCAWPEPFAPGEGIIWDYDLADGFDLDEEGEELLAVRKYFDQLVEEGILHDDYSFNEDYEYKTDLPMMQIYDDNGNAIGYEFLPDIGEEYWLEEAGFDLDTRSGAHEMAAEFAYRYVVSKGLWVNLKDAGVVPSIDENINQLQELYQKKYVEDKPEYEFHESYGDVWRCDCGCGGIAGHSLGPSKTAAKKKVAYMVIVKLLDAAGICEDEWLEEMYEMM